MSLFFRALSIPVLTATAVASRLRFTPVIRANEVPTTEDSGEPEEEVTEPVIHIRFPGLPMSWIRDGELPLLRKSVRLFKGAQAMLQPENRRVAYDLLTRERIARSNPTVRERLDAIRLLMKKAGR